MWVDFNLVKEGIKNGDLGLYHLLVTTIKSHFNPIFFVLNAQTRAGFPFKLFMMYLKCKILNKMDLQTNRECNKR